MPEIFGSGDEEAPVVEKKLPEIEKDIPDDCDYSLITTEEQLDDLCRRMLAAPILAVDTETEGLLHSDLIVGICISVKPKHGAYIPLRHEPIEGIRDPNQLDPLLVYSKIGPILQEKPLTGHNTKFDRKKLLLDGVDANFTDDTLFMAALSGRFDQGKRGLKYLVQHCLGYKMADIDSLFVSTKRKKVEIKAKTLRPEDIMIYGCKDADYSFRLYEYFKPTISKLVSEKIYRREMDLMRVVADMEMTGVPVSREFLRNKSDEAERIICRLQDELLSEIREKIDDPEYTVNFNSPKQLGELIYDRLGIPCVHTSASGARSTAGHVLEELAKKHRIMERIHTFRLLWKLRGTFLEKMHNRIQEDGRIRGGFNQIGTASGRFSSSDPNLQNIPKDQTFHLWKLDDDQEIRDTFGQGSGVDGDTLRFNEDESRWEAYSYEAERWGDYYLGVASSGRHYAVHHGELWEAWRCPTRQFISASENHYIVEADYSQIELKVLAGESKEPTLLEAYATGDDVHKKTAAAIFGVPFKNVTKEQRSIGKTVNFGLLYGAGPQRISQELNITMDEAKDIVERYFANLPYIKSWINTMKRHARDDGYAKTSFGRIRMFPNIKPGSGKEKALAAREEREAVNHHIQGAAADVLKMALCRIDKNMRARFGDKVRLICTVHDSVMLECHNSVRKDHVTYFLKCLMEMIDLKSKEEPYTYWPTLEVDIGVGKTWAMCEDYDVPKDLPSDFPAKLDVSTLPRVRHRMLGRECEGEFSEVVDWKSVVIPDPEPIYVDTVESLDMETGEVIVDDANADWNLTVDHTPTRAALMKFAEYIKSRKADSSDSRKLKLIYHNVEGEKREYKFSVNEEFSRDDQFILKKIFGPCKLHQDLNSLDVDLVIDGLGLSL